eukprot:XP_001701164.1 predicted protein [Chlamydomonas reinhardtii]
MADVEDDSGGGVDAGGGDAEVAVARQAEPAAKRRTSETAEGAKPAHKLPAQADEVRRKEEEQARLEARRLAIRERIAKQHEVAAKLAEERAKAEEAAKGAIDRFLAAKPLHLKLLEEYEKQQAELEAEKKRAYEEGEARNKLVRPHQIMSGQTRGPCHYGTAHASPPLYELAPGQARP